MFDLSVIEDLKEAPYNPRHIDEATLASLKTSIETFGDISGIVWNKRTGHLVCGHQRLKAIKSKYPSAHYDKEKGEIVIAEEGEKVGFKVRIVDWDEQTEKTANIAANSNTVSGQFTQETENILAEIEAGLPDLFDKLRLSDVFITPQDEQVTQTIEHADVNVPQMELFPYEHYDYVLVLAKNTHDWAYICEKFGLERVNASPVGKKKIGLGRAIDAAKLRAKLESA